jgi:mercuric ion transport protein
MPAIRRASRADDVTERDDRRLLETGLVGTVLAALCCFTPLLAVLMGAVGFASAVGWIDYVLFPALAFFIALTAYAVVRRRRRLSARHDG